MVLFYFQLYLTFFSDKFPLSQEELSEYNLKLLTMNKASPWGNLAMGLTCKLENKPEEAKAYLRVGKSCSLPSVCITAHMFYDGDDMKFQKMINYILDEISKTILVACGKLFIFTSLNRC